MKHLKLLLLIVICMKSLHAFCYDLSGIWFGYCGAAYYDFFGYDNYPQYKTVIRFFDDTTNYSPEATSGQGEQIDYDASKYDKAYYRNFTWQIDNGDLYITYGNYARLRITSLRINDLYLKGEMHLQDNYNVIVGTSNISFTQNYNDFWSYYYNLRKQSDGNIIDFTIDNLQYSIISDNPKSVSVKAANTSISGDIAIPETVKYNDELYSVVNINSFKNCSNITSLTIPNSVTSVGEGAFKGCTNLSSVYISDLSAWCKISFFDSTSNPLFYARHLFLNESEINELIIPSNTTDIKRYTFINCSALSSITIPSSVTSIGAYSFENCSSTESVVIPNSVTSIGSYVFENCNSIKIITIPNSVTSIGECAFSGCSSLTSITIPNSMTSIGYSAFSGCSSLTSVTLLCNNIGSWFSRNKTIETVIIGDEVESISGSAFYGCSGLTSINIPNGVTSIGECAFSGCTGLTSLTIGNSVSSIGGSAFYGCSGLTSVIIPNSVTTIGDYTFYNCTSLSNIIIGEKVGAIGKQAFSGCTSMEDVYCYAEKVKETNANAFKDSPIEWATLHVPASTIELYQKNSPWSGFGIIVPLTNADPKPTAIETINNNDIVVDSYYALDGQQIVAPRKGINIVRMSDGTVKKVIVK